MTLSPTGGTEVNFNGTIMDGDYTLRDDKSELNDGFYSKADNETNDLMCSTLTDSKENFNHLINQRISRFEVTGDQGR
jgi:hypothetical protein